MPLLRLFTILKIIARYRVDQLLPDSRLKKFLRRVILLFPSGWKKVRPHSTALGLRLALEQLGPIFVKFGQTLSTRADLFSPDLIEELSKLQDQVPPFKTDLVEQTLYEAYGQRPEAIFKTFSKEPLAAASVAQVHAAILKEGQDVIVKIIRPGIEKAIQQDLQVLYFLARFAMKRWQDARRLRLVELVAEFEKIIFQELDLLREATSARRLRQNFQGSNLLYVPEVYLEYCRPQVLVMERICGTRISDLTALKKQNVNLEVLAKRGVEIFYTQVFRDKFFHADMHPGNIFVDTTNPEAPRYLGIDFGIMGTLSDEDHYYLAQNFLAFFNQDYRKVAKLHIDSGWVPRETRIDELEMAIRIVCEPVFNKSLSDISFAIILLKLFQIARQFNMEVQPQLALLQKTLLNVEGLGRQLYADLNLWETAKPYLEAMMKKQLGFKSFLKTLRENLPTYFKVLPELPILFATQAEEARAQTKKLMALEQALKMSIKTQRKMLWWLGAGVVVIGVTALVHIF